MSYLSFDVGIKNLAFCKLNPDKHIEDWGIINLNDNPQCCSHLRKRCDKQSSCVYKDDNGELQYYCTAHSKQAPKKCKKLNTNNDILELSKKCVSQLRNLNLDNVKYVLIENQPALKNPVMKSVQMIIYTFFVMDGVLNPSSSIEKIHMVNARNKLKVYKGEPVECNKKTKYDRNKFLSIVYTNKMIHLEDEIFKKMFEESKKKDDLADAYLQGIYWIEK